MNDDDEQQRVGSGDTVDAAAERRPDGMPRGKPFQPGQSGNPKGGQRGPFSRKAGNLKDAIISAAEAVGFEHDPTTDDGLKAYLAHLARREPKSFSSLLGRIVPLMPVRVEMPKIEKASDLVTASGVIASAMANGELAPHEASALSTIVANAAKTIETHVLAEKIEQLEQAAAQEAKP